MASPRSRMPGERAMPKEIRRNPFRRIVQDVRREVRYHLLR